jgi:hypothetical protein
VIGHGKEDISFTLKNRMYVVPQHCDFDFERHFGMHWIRHLFDSDLKLIQALLSLWILEQATMVMV